MRARIQIYSLLFILFVLPISWDVLDPRGRSISFVVIIIGTLVWITLRVIGRYPLKIPKIWLPIFLYAILQAVLLVVAPIPIYGIYWSISSFLIATALLFIVDSKQFDWKFRLWENALIIVTTIIALIDLLLVVFKYSEWWRIKGTLLSLPPFFYRAPGGFMGHPNYIAGLINLIFPIVIFRLIRATNLLRKAIWVGILGLLSLVLYMSSSRGAWLGLACGIIVMGSLYVLLYKKMINWKVWIHNLRSLASKDYAIPTFIIVILALAVISIGIVKSISLVPHGSLALRNDIWAYGIRLITRSPIWGNGAGSLPFLFALRSEGFGIDPVFDTHNFILQMIAETGIVSIILLCWAGYLLVKIYQDKYSENRKIRRDLDYLVVTGGALTTAIVHNQFQILYGELIYPLFVIILLGLLYWITPKLGFYILKNQYHAALTIIFPVSIIVISGFYSLKGSFEYLDGLRESLSENWAKAQDHICRSAESNPEIPFFAHQCAIASAKMAYDTGDIRWLNTAIHWGEVGIETDPYWFNHWVNLGSYKWYRQDYQSAQETLRHAADMAPNLAFIWFNLGLLYEQSGDIKQAVDSMQKAVCLNPAIVESLLIINTNTFMGVNQDNCSPQTNWYKPNKPYLDYLIKSNQALQEGDLRKAEEMIMAAIHENPTNAYTYVNLADINSLQGKNDEAVEYLATALFIDSNSATIQFATGQVYLNLGHEDKAFEHLAKSFEIASNPAQSNRYYTDAYRQMRLPVDSSPFLYSAFLTEKRMETFIYLANHLEQEGDVGKANEVRKWIDWNTPPIGFDE